MAFFLSLFGPSLGIEKQLQDMYVPIFQDLMKISPSQARNNFRRHLKLAKATSKKDGTANLPLNAGDILLKKETTDPGTRSMLAKKRKEGVRNEDIRWWWNMHDLERCMMVEIDNITRGAVYIDGLENGMSFEEAAAKVRKYHPMYGEPNDTSNSSGEDRPLPYELKDRVNAYIEKKRPSGPDDLKKQVEQSSSFNALVRKEIRKGHI